MIIRAQGSKKALCSGLCQVCFGAILSACFFLLFVYGGFRQVKATKPAKITCFLTIRVTPAYTSHSIAAGVSV